MPHVLFGCGGVFGSALCFLISNMKSGSGVQEFYVKSSDQFHNPKALVILCFPPSMCIPYHSFSPNLGSTRIVILLQFSPDV